MSNNLRKLEDSSIQDLISRFKNGDKESFGTLWEKVRDHIYRLMKPGLDETTAEDFTSGVCVKLYENGLKNYQPRPNVSFISWLDRFTRNRKINLLKKKRPLNFSGLPGEADIAERIYSDGKTPLRILIEREDEEIRAKAIKLLPGLMNKLSAEERYVLEEYFYNEQTDREISRRLNHTERQSSRYKMMRRRAVRKLERFFRMNGIKDFPART